MLTHEWLGSARSATGDQSYVKGEPLLKIEGHSMRPNGLLYIKG